ncbi:lipopolysaccharide biosynthesis protein [Motilibacter deserti]|uniref:Lipopolysaccharide biosynthesis protein n=1 Tax=Motilibacter deserti TaxID=2714956 RepID=A0ABX0GUM5_9ACTN|nr:lipopolysaccharide biosynthesis protein [Motilibacter deserti]NHC13440.1 lipopolysaccharide biosynthesis protein [Motilibacter deserti]
MPGVSAAAVAVDNAGADPGSLSDKVGRGIAWSGTGTLLVRLLRFALFIVLARLIAPEHFGVVALATVFIALLSVVATSGLGPSIIQRAQLERSYLDSAFGFTVALGALMCLAMLAAAPLLGRAFGEPELTPVLRVLSLSFLLTGLASVPQALMVRALAMKALMVRSVVAALISSVVALVLALLGAGVWALVVQTLLEALVSCVGVWLQAGYRPGLSFSVGALRDLLSWGYKTSGMDLLNALTQRLDDLLIGAVLGTEALGIYSVAYRLLTQINEAVSGTSRNVAFSAFSRMQNEPGRLAAALVRVLRMMYVVLLPVYVFLAVLAGPVVVLLFGAEWSAAADVLPLLCALGALLPCIDMGNAVLQANGRPGRALQLTLLRAAVAGAGFAVTVQFGLVAVAASAAGAALLLVVPTLRAVGSLLPFHLRDFVTVLVRPVVCVAVAGGLLVLVEASVGTAALIVASAVPAGLLYLTTVVAADRATRTELSAVLRRVAPSRVHRLVSAT